LVFYVHSHKETFTILYYLFTNFSHSSIIFFIIVIIKYYHHLIQDYCLFFYLTSSICLSIILYMFLTMISCSHNKHHYSAHIRQFISKSSYIDRFTSVNDSELNIESLIKNLKNVIMKKLSVLYVTESNETKREIHGPGGQYTLSQSSTLVSVSDSPASAISVFITLTPATSASAAAFVTSSSHFKKMLYRL
ncbi:hypothetical protein BDBG_18104, partial [Blastomyces gilchristii SLH14081]